MNTLLYQIYFDEQSLSNCWKHRDVRLYYNEVCTEYYENSVIANLLPQIKHTKKEFVGVFSHKAQQKLSLHNRNFSIDKVFEVCKKGEFDVLSFFHNLRKQTIFHNDHAIRLNNVYNELLARIGINYHSNVNARFIVMQNHFIARQEIYVQYIEEALIPALEVLSNELHEKASYPAPYSGAGSSYTLAPFVLEKLFTAWIHDKVKFANNGYICKHFKDV